MADWRAGISDRDAGAPAGGGWRGSDADPVDAAGAGRPGDGWQGRTGWGPTGSASDWTGRPGWSGPTDPRGADWAAARESVRRFGESAQRAAAQAGEAARDPELRESAGRAVRTVADALTTTVGAWAADLRDRARSPRWSDPDFHPERPPVAPDDDRG